MTNKKSGGNGKNEDSKNATINNPIFPKGRNVNWVHWYNVVNKDINRC